MNWLQKMSVWLLLSIATVSTAHAEVELTCKHDLVSFQQNDNGSALTFNVAISNTGSSSLFDVKLTAKAPLIVEGDPVNSLNIGKLIAGETITVTWTVSSRLSTNQLRPGLGLPLSISGEAVDDAGKIQVFSILDHGGAL